MLKDKKYQEIINQFDEYAKLEAEITWAYAYDKPECIRKRLISCSVETRSRFIDLLLQLMPDDIE